MHTKPSLAVAVCVTALVGVSAAPAFAGEITGPPGVPGKAGSATGHRTPAVTNARSGCAANGLNDMNPLQEAMRDSHSFQCGFCTPGFMMQITALLEDNPSPSEDEIRETLSGNICRCTGYESILNGVLKAAAR